MLVGRSLHGSSILFVAFVSPNLVLIEMLMIRNILAVIAGIVIGTIVNMGLIKLGHTVVPLPPGADVSTMEAIAASMSSFGPEQFIFPFLAHAVGTLVGTLVATLIAASHKMKIAMALGFFFLLGGIAAVVLLPAPLWFDVIDLVFAYIPMAWLGAKLGGAGLRRRYRSYKI